MPAVWLAKHSNAVELEKPINSSHVVRKAPHLMCSTSLFDGVASSPLGRSCKNMRLWLAKRDIILKFGEDITSRNQNGQALT